MKGYCSNSPLRCSKAQNMEIIDTTSVCPDCDFAIIKVNDDKKLRAAVKFALHIILLLLSILGMLVLYFY